MLPHLYLDYARLGPLSKSAAKLHHGFLSLVAGCPTTPSLIPLLIHGNQTPARGIGELPDLAGWRGIHHMKRLCTSTFNATNDADVYFASRSRSLMRLAAEMMFRVCTHCLTFDVGWSTYQCDLGREAARVGKRVSELKIQRSIFADRWTPNQLIENVCSQFEKMRCDGIFLPSVDCLGVRLPVQALIKRLQSVSELRFVVGDASQAVGHVPLQNDLSRADLVIGGTHKWLGSYFPLGMAVASNPNSQFFVRNTIDGCLNRQQATDGLMYFLRELESNGRFPNPETVDV
ncbi:MAG: hypothetical protein R3C56_42380, partial [Pirellulaceae bacterium]